MKCFLKIVLVLCLSGCANKFFSFEPYNYDINESAKINIKGIKGCSFKIVGKRLVYRQKIKLKNSGMPKNPEGKYTDEYLPGYINSYCRKKYNRATLSEQILGGPCTEIYYY